MEQNPTDNVVINQSEISSHETTSRSKRRETASPTSIKILLDTLGKDTLAATKKSSQRNENSRKTISPNQMKQFLQEIQGLPCLAKSTNSSEEMVQRELHTTFTEAFFPSQLLPSGDKSDKEVLIQEAKSITPDKVEGRDLTLEPEDAQAFLEELKRTENELISQQNDASNTQKTQDSMQSIDHKDRRTLDVEELYALETAFRKEQCFIQKADDTCPKVSTPPRTRMSEEGSVDTETEPLNHISGSLKENELPMDIDIEREIVEEFAELRAATIKNTRKGETDKTGMEVVEETPHPNNNRTIIRKPEETCEANVISEQLHESPVKRLTSAADAEGADPDTASPIMTSKSFAIVPVADTDKSICSIPQTHPTDSPEQPQVEFTSLYSPPPTRLQVTAHLRSCLSSVKKHSQVRELTPNKSVNFGPPQGIEFNYGSPAISMTPMCATTAKAMFPVEQVSTTSVSSDEDMETSLNTSILDHANAQSESSDDEKDQAQTSQQRHQVDNAPKHRRFSLKGVTPLENIANARRQRRSSVGLKQSTPKGSQTKSDLQKQKDDHSSQNAVQQPHSQSRLAFADSSASSDGEDMDITGEYSNHFNVSAALLQRGSNYKSSQSNISTLENAFLAPTAQHSDTQKISRRQSSLGSSLGGSPVLEPTIEVGTLGDLVTEAAEFEREPIPDANANGGEESDAVDMQEMHKDDSVGTSSSLNNLEENEADVVEGSQTRPLDPIIECDENSVTSTSMMSVVVSEDEDTQEHRKSVIVNLSSHFDRMESTSVTVLAEKDQPRRDLEITEDTHLGTPKSKKKQFQSPPRVTRTNRTCEQLYEMLQLDAIELDTVDSKAPNLNSSDDVDALTASCCNVACLELITTSLDELTTWNTAMDESLVLISKELVSVTFGAEKLPLELVETIQALGRTTADTMQSEFYQWREKIEKNCNEKLALTLGKMELDVKQLQGQISTLKEFEMNELEALEELIDKERQWSQLLDALEEQEAVEVEYKQTMQELQAECSSLTLDTSIMKQRIAQAENDLETPPMQEAEIQTLSSQVFWLEQKYELEQRLTFWKIRNVTPTSFSVDSDFLDVLFSSLVRVDVCFDDSQHAVIELSSTLKIPSLDFKVKRRKLDRDMKRPDATCLVARHLLQTERVEALVNATNQRSGEPITATDKLRELEIYLLHCYRLLRDLRKLSTNYTLRYEDKTLWIDFMRFDSKSPVSSRSSYKFSVGFAFFDTIGQSSRNTSLQLIAQPLVETRYGPVSEQQVWSYFSSKTDPLALDMLPNICARLSSITKS